MSAEVIYQYHPGKTLVPVDAPETVLRIADSWLVRDGQTRALHWHRQRFLSSVLSLTTIHERDITPFWDAAMACIPEAGLWFPRIELAGSFHLQSATRSAFMTVISLISGKCHVTKARIWRNVSPCVATSCLQVQKKP